METELFFDHSFMQFVWFTIFVLLLIGYTVLDGFDLGVGMLHLFSTKDQERRLMLNSIGPVWDGNEVWLVTAGGALFAGFPKIYATLCSAFYFPIIILLTGLIFRAVAIEFRSKQPMLWWRWMWDIFFTLASFVIAFSLGVALGNLIYGIPLNERGIFIGNVKDLIHPYPLLVGALTVVLFMMHGSLYLMIKTEGEFHEKMRLRVTPSMITYMILYAITTMVTLIYVPHMIENIRQRPVFFLLAVIDILLIANIAREVYLKRDVRAFLCSCLNMVCLITLYAVGTYPIVVRGVNIQEYSLTIFNASSSNLTLHILLLIACIGVPLVISYTIAIYYIFRGKVTLDDHSY